jgi:hypothetical protein
MAKLPVYRFPVRSSVTVDIDMAKIDEAVLALLYLGRHDGDRTWKSFDWDGAPASEQAFRRKLRRSFWNVNMSWVVPSDDRLLESTSAMSPVSAP